MFARLTCFRAEGQTDLEWQHLNPDVWQVNLPGNTTNNKGLPPRTRYLFERSAVVAFPEQASNRAHENVVTTQSFSPRIHID